MILRAIIFYGLVMSCTGGGGGGGDAAPVANADTDTTDVDTDTVSQAYEGGTSNNFSLATYSAQNSFVKQPTINFSSSATGFNMSFYGTDECITEIGSKEVTSENSSVQLDELPAGSYTFYYKATDSNDNSTECTTTGISHTITLVRLVM